ncbi:ABC transporter ATP-binding protein [Enterococcus sp. 669A]|uniref:ABC transporter ATP-binding protein n=1 Tax=Candidatus Enterococcus moelleringii TaxID=2815325 RepID=A0ABS3LF44_9ENTE|nr:ABC transporter ATP-binding protein [Enterococcus sp. 669A]MBO1307695.1 ABC transporter ATP-binding protein [Enterococcus sp. 669A]
MTRNNGLVAVEGQNITKQFEVGTVDTTVLRDLSVKIDRGEFVSIMGPSGSGKSTLLYILSGLDVPTKGSVLLNGRDISGMDDGKMSVMRRRSIGFVFQFYNLIPNLNVEENILLPVLLDGKDMKAYKKKLDHILEIVGLTERRKHTPRELSGGQQQRVAIARALINDPDIIFADEPTGNLDSKSGTEILELLREINQVQGKTILMVTHSEDAAKYGNRTIYVRDGVVEQG